MTSIDINDFDNEKECILEDERYSVRSNGAVLRHTPPGKRSRPSDNHWTFGKTNTANAYLHIASVRVHRIVATAFHGDPPDPKYVVDHIDTNCRNNRPENLRWLTRLENALSNPVTRKKIIFLCGSIEAFLEDPSILQSKVIESNYAWMRTVTKEEAQNCKESMDKWAASDKKPKGGSLGEWVYKKQIERKFPVREYVDAGGSHQNNINEYYYEESDLTKALTPHCAQRNWRVPSNFPCCPEVIGYDPLGAYAQNLIAGANFSYNEKYPESVVVDSVRTKNNSSILVLCQKSDLKPWSVAEVTFENGLFIHKSLGSFFSKEGADKVFCVEQGLEWNGGDVFDDFC
jgi:hypothetical protein